MGYNILSEYQYSTSLGAEQVKVLHIISGGDSGGARTHVLSLLGELRRTDQIRLLCLGDGPAARSAEKAGLPCTVVPARFDRGLRETARIARDGGFDLLHCHGARANLTGALAKRELDIPVISTVHSDHTLDYLGRPGAALVYGTLDRMALEWMDALVCVSEAMARTYRSRGFQKVYHIYNGVDFDAPTAPRRRTDDAVVFGTAARLDPVKDLPAMIRGFAAAAERDPRIRLVIAGSGREERRLRSLIAQLGMGERISLPGWTEDTESFYADLDAVLLTSISETFPYALLSAARYSLPAAATRAGGVEELIVPGEGGFLLEPGDTGGLTDAILALAGDAELRRSMGAALRRRARERFSLAAMAGTQREIYGSVLSREGGRA